MSNRAATIFGRGFLPEGFDFWSVFPLNTPMRQTKTLVSLFYLLVAGSAWAQTESKPVFGINFSGFIKSDMFYDSRQTVSIREGHFLLFPKGEMADKEGHDLNAVQSLQMLSIQSRLQGRITGPDAFGAKTSGLIEAEFFGTSDADINGFRLRQAFVKMNWAKTELLVGQFWHPMFVTESFPEVVSFNTGAPFQPFNRSPQVRLTRAFGRWSLAASAIAQRDFTSSGPDGVSTAYARNSMVPEFNLKLQYAAKNTAGTEFLLGAEGDILTLRPRTATAAGYAADATVASAAGMAFLQVKTRGLTFKAETVYGGNLHHLTMAGGYAVDAVTDPVRGFVTYAPLRTITGWTELMTNGTSFQAGIFAGYSKNLGAESDLAGPAYARGADIDRLARVSPRLVFNAGKARFAAECEWTGAWYGTPLTDGTVSGGRLVSNIRVLGAVYLFF